MEVKKRMKEILLKLKKTFWKLESIYLIVFVAFMFGGLSFIPQVKEHPEKLWNVIWNCSFGLFFMTYFFTSKNPVLRELVRFRCYIVFAIEMLGYLILFMIAQAGDASRASYVVTFVLCELIIVGGIYFSWQDYKKEKYLATKCQGRGTKPCNIDMPCLMCEDYRGYMTPAEISAALETRRIREEKRQNRKDFFKKLRRKA